MSDHMNFHLPGGLHVEDEESVEAEISEEHVVLVQRSNEDEPMQN